MFQMRISSLQMIACGLIALAIGFEEVAQAGRRIVNRTAQVAPSPTPDSSKQAAENELGKRAVNRTLNQGLPSPSPDSSSQRAMPGKRSVN
jgi:hypothetical protein